MDTIKFFYKYPNLITFFKVVYHQVKNNKYDFPYAIVGDTGSGKSMLLCHHYEIWKKVFLNEEVSEDDAVNIRANRREWLDNFKDLKELSMNPNDEAADGLLSKESMKKFSRTIEKLYNVNRKKLLISPITIPDFFDLPPYFRKRIRGLFYVYERGKFKFYSKRGIMFLNSLNSNRKIKSMDVAYPLFTGVFPDYTGVMRSKYDEISQRNVDSILDEVIKENNVEKNTKQEILKPVIENMLRENPKYTLIELADKTGISKSHIQRIKKQIEKV